MTIAPTWGKHGVQDALLTCLRSHVTTWWNQDLNSGLLTPGPRVFLLSKGLNKKPTTGQNWYLVLFSFLGIRRPHFPAPAQGGGVMWWVLANEVWEEVVHDISRWRQGRALVWLILLSGPPWTPWWWRRTECWGGEATQKTHPESWVAAWRMAVLENHPELHWSLCEWATKFWVKLQRFGGLFVTAAWSSSSWLI